MDSVSKRIFVAVVLLSVINSCSSNPKDPAEPLWGQWQYYETENGYDAFQYDIEFVSDGTFLILDTPHLSVNTFEYGILEGNRLRLTALGQSEILWYELEGDQLKLIFEDGYNLYRRSKEILITNNPSDRDDIESTKESPIDGKTSVFFSAKNESSPTPEEVVVRFTTYIKNQEFGNALNMFSINYSAERFNFLGYVERLQSFGDFVVLLPTEYDAYIPLNQALAIRGSSIQIRYFIYNLLIPGCFSQGTIVLDKIEPESLKLIPKLDPSRLADLELIRVDLAAPDIQLSDRHQNAVIEMGKIEGYISQKQLIALYKFEDKYYLGGFTISEFEDGWYIHSLDALLVGIDYYLCVTETTEQEYLEKIK